MFDFVSFYVLPLIGYFLCISIPRLTFLVEMVDLFTVLSKIESSSFSPPPLLYFYFFSWIKCSIIFAAPFFLCISVCWLTLLVVVAMVGSRYILAVSSTTIYLNIYYSEHNISIHPRQILIYLLRQNVLKESKQYKIFFLQMQFKYVY